MNVTLFGRKNNKRTLQDVTKLRISRSRDHPGLLGWALNSPTSVLTRDTQKRPTDRQTQKRQPGEDRVTQSGAKEHLEPPEAGRGKEWILLESPPERARPCSHLDFGSLTSGTMRQYISVILSHPVCGPLFVQPQETSTLPFSPARP